MMLSLCGRYVVEGKAAKESLRERKGRGEKMLKKPRAKCVSGARARTGVKRAVACLLTEEVTVTARAQVASIV